MVQSTSVGSFDIPTETLAALLDKFDRDDVAHGSGAGAVHMSDEDGDVYGLLDDGDDDHYVKLHNFNKQEISTFTSVESLQDRLEESRPDPPEGPFIHAGNDGSNYGVVLPTDAHYEMSPNEHDGSIGTIYWDEADAVGEKHGWDASAECSVTGDARGAHVSDIEVVDEIPE